MFCPKCRAEYTPGFTRCTDCNVQLVEVPPKEDDEIDPNVKFLKILETHDSMDVPFIKSILDSTGIHYFIENEMMNSLGGGTGSSIIPASLMVLEEDAPKAVDLLKQFNLNYRRFNFL